MKLRLIRAADASDQFAVVHQLGVGADLAVVAGDELEEAQDAALVHSAEDEGRDGFEQAFLDVLAETDEAHREVLGLRLLDLPDVEVDEAHREHVVGEEGERVLRVGGVRLEGVPQKLDVFLVLRALVPRDTVPAGYKGGREVVWSDWRLLPMGESSFLTTNCQRIDSAEKGPGYDERESDYASISV